MDDSQNNASNALVAWIIGFAAFLAVAIALTFSFVAAFSDQSGGPVASASSVATGEQARVPLVTLVEVDQPPALATGDGVPALVSLHFATGKTELPTDAAAQVQSLIEHLKATPEAKLGISGFHDSTGDPALNRELAKNRALATHAMLVAAGAPADRLVLVRPQVAEAGRSDDPDARRVDIFPSH